MTGLRRLANNIYAGIATGAVLTLALLIPTATFAEDAAKVDATLGVANVTTGGTDYKQSATAAQGQTVKVQLYYVNQAATDSDKVAKNVRAKITLPSGGKKQTVKALVQTDGADAVNRQVTVDLNQDDMTLQYIPGSAIWKHNTGTADKPKIVESRVSDDIVNNGQGTILENQKPGKNFAATVTIQARVNGPGVSTSVRSQKQGQSSQWSANNTAKPGETMRYLISYQNTSKSTQSNVIVRDSLPAGMTLVNGSTTIINRNQQSGVKAGNDSIATHAGVDIGSYTSGANAYVTFDATLPSADKLACGANALTNTSVVKLANGNESFATAVTTVNRDCAGQTPPSTTPTPTPATPSSCDTLKVSKQDGRKVTVTMKYEPKNASKLKAVTFDFGDNGTPLTTDKTTVTHTYATDGSYTVSTRLLLTTSKDKDETVTNGSCSAVVVIGSGAVTPTSPTGKTNDLPGTGPGEVFGLFAVVAVLGAIGHRIFLTRRLNRASW